MESLKLLLKLSFIFLFASTVVQSSFAANRLAVSGHGKDPECRRRRPGLEMDSDEAARADFIKKYLKGKLSSVAEAMSATRQGLNLLEILTNRGKEELQFFRGQKVDILIKAPYLLPKSLSEEFFLKYEGQTFNDENVAEIYKNLVWDKTFKNQVNRYIKTRENLKGLYRNESLLEELLVGLQQQQNSQPEKEAEIREWLVESLYGQRKTQDEQDEKELEKLSSAEERKDQN